MRYVHYSPTNGHWKGVKNGFFYDLVLDKEGGGPGVLIFLGGFGNHFFVLKTSRNATKHKIPSFNMKGDVISDHFLML